MLGTTVVSGMSAATLLGIFFVPALFVFVERLGGHKDAHVPADADTPQPVAKMERPRHQATGGE